MQDAFGITIDAEEDRTIFPYFCFCSCCMCKMVKRITAADQGVYQDAPLPHSNGATTVMRIAWYDKVLTSYICMLTGIILRC